MARVPPSLLLDFFDSATKQLNQHPQLDYSQHKSSNSSTPPIPPSLDDQRRTLLQIQLESLEQAVDRYNKEKNLVDTPDAVSVAAAQEALRSNDASFARGMEDAARSAFARSVLLAELDWDRQVCRNSSISTTEKEERTRGLKDGDNVDTMSREAIKEFCGLCVAVINMSEVQAYLESGGDIQFGAQNGDDGVSNEENIDDGKGQMSDSRSTTPPERMERIHRLLLRAVGYRSDFAKAEMQRIFFPDNGESRRPTRNDGPDSELQESFQNFLTAMSVAANKAAASSSQDNTGGDLLSDGFTRVVSVQHSERTVAASEVGAATMSNGAVPLAQSMEEHDDDRQRRQLAMARQAAALQHVLLNDLDAMGDDERSKVLAEAKEAHISFLKRVSELPTGEERLHFLQSIDPETQRKLALHKLWEARSSIM